jgi:hypothetical protein
MISCQVNGPWIPQWGRSADVARGRPQVISFSSLSRGLLAPCGGLGVVGTLRQRP